MARTCDGTYTSSFPDKSRERHYLDVLSTPKTNRDGSPREIDDFLPRAQVKKRFAKAELHNSDEANLAELSKELCVAVNLLKDSVKLSVSTCKC